MSIEQECELHIPRRDFYMLRSSGRVFLTLNVLHDVCSTGDIHGKTSERLGSETYYAGTGVNRWNTLSAYPNVLSHNLFYIHLTERSKVYERGSC